MLNLDKPTSYYFDICQQIIWYRLTYDKLYILYSQEARTDINSIWHKALRHCPPFNDDSIFQSRILSTYQTLNDGLVGNDEEWQHVLHLVEPYVDMRRIVDDYFLGVDSLVICQGIEAGVYDV